MASSFRIENGAAEANNCRALIRPNIPTNTHLSYTIRIKIPKLLVKAMQRRSHRNNLDGVDQSRLSNKKKYWASKVRSIFPNVFRNKKSHDMRGDHDHERAHSDGPTEERETQMPGEVDSYDEYLKSSASYKERLEESSLVVPDKDYRHHQPPNCVSLSIFSSSKYNRSNSTSSSSSKSCNNIASRTNIGSTSTSTKEGHGHGGLNHYFPRVSIRKPVKMIMRRTLSLKKARKQTEKEGEGEGEGEEEDDDEEEDGGGLEGEGEDLCKRRILMGVKCRPINMVDP